MPKFIKIQNQYFLTIKILGPGFEGAILRAIDCPFKTLPYIVVSPAKQGRHIVIMAPAAASAASHFWFPINNS